MTGLGPWAALAAGALFAACAFDGTTDFEPGFEEPLLDTAEPGSVAPAPEAEIVSFLATNEETRRGSLVLGSYEDSFAVDGLVEVIEAEIRGSEEKLEHKWHFGDVPAGSYQLNLVGLPFSPEPIDTFVVEFAADGVRGHTLILALGSADVVRTFEGDLTLPERADVEIRVKLPKNIDVIDDDEVPFRRLDVDYLALTRTAP